MNAHLRESIHHFGLGTSGGTDDCGEAEISKGCKTGLDSLLMVTNYPINC